MLPAILIVITVVVALVVLGLWLRFVRVKVVRRVIVHTPTHQIAGLLVNQRGQFLRLAEPRVLIGEDPPYVDGQVWIPRDVVMWVQVNN